MRGRACSIARANLLRLPPLRASLLGTISIKPKLSYRTKGRGGAGQMSESCCAPPANQLSALRYRQRLGDRRTTASAGAGVEREFVAARATMVTKAIDMPEPAARMARLDRRRGPQAGVQKTS